MSFVAGCSEKQWWKSFKKAIGGWFQWSLSWRSGWHYVNENGLEILRRIQISFHLRYSCWSCQLLILNDWEIYGNVRSQRIEQLNRKLCSGLFIWLIQLRKSRFICIVYLIWLKSWFLGTWHRLKMACVIFKQGLRICFRIFLRCRKFLSGQVSTIIKNENCSKTREKGGSSGRSLKFWLARGSWNRFGNFTMDSNLISPGIFRYYLCLHFCLLISTDQKIYGT